MSFRSGKRTNFIATATANANNLPWQTDWQSPQSQVIRTLASIFSPPLLLGEQEDWIPSGLITVGVLASTPLDFTDLTNLNIKEVISSFFFQVKVLM